MGIGSVLFIFLIINYLLWFAYSLIATKVINICDKSYKIRILYLRQKL